MHLSVPAVDVDKLTGETIPETSAQVRNRVTKAREIQIKRFKHDGIITNSEMNNQMIRKYCQLEDDAAGLLKQAIVKMKLSARSYFRILKLSRTIADLADREKITINDVAEALQYRVKEE